MTVDVLGSMRVAVGGRPVAVTARRLRLLLAVLAMSAGRAVSVERLTAAVWEEDLPTDSRRSLSVYVTRLREALGGASISTHPGAYSLRTSPECVDALRFGRLVGAAATEESVHARRALLTRALELWRGEPFEGLPSQWLTQFEGPPLVEQYLAAVEQLVDLELAAGRADRLTADLRQLIARHPLRESLWARFLLVLRQGGRISEALAAYEQFRARVSDSMGVDPGGRLRQIHADLLGDTVPVGGLDERPRRCSPYQIPPNIAGFTGRLAALEELNSAVDEAGRGGDRAVTIVAISGAAGIGKTTLAVYWAHQIADRFPDGNLYADLGGYGPRDLPASTSEILSRFLNALGMPVQQVPTDPDELLGLYRSMLAGKRMMMVLDNARDAQQVRSLLPGAPGCLVIATSRDDLASLVATQGARLMTLCRLPEGDARQLLARRLGHDRLVAEPAAVDAIIAACSGLPLALAMAAAQAAARRDFRLAELAAQLREVRTDLGILDGGSASANLRAVFSW